MDKTLGTIKIASKVLKPWFKTEGREDGDRTLKQQLRGLGDLIDRVSGKTVLDIGCAEGLIAMHLIDRGAIAVHGIEMREDFVLEGLRIRGDRAVALECANANDYEPVRQYDIVIMLAVLHKLKDPTAACKKFAAAAREMVVLRLPPKYAPRIVDDRSGGVIHDMSKAMGSSGFMLKNACLGPRAEWMGYYERV